MSLFPEIHRQTPRASISRSSNDVGPTATANQIFSTNVEALDAHDATAEQGVPDTFIFVRHDRRSSKLLIELPPEFSMRLATALERQLRKQLDEDDLLHHKRHSSWSSSHQAVDIKQIDGGGLLIRLPVRERHRQAAVDCVSTFIGRMTTQCEFLGITEETFPKLLETKNLIEAVGTDTLDFQGGRYYLSNKAYVSCVTDALDLGITQIADFALNSLDEVIDHYLDKGKSSFLGDLSNAICKALHGALHVERNDELLFRLIPFGAKLWTPKSIKSLSEFCCRFPHRLDLPFSLLKTGRDELAAALIGDVLGRGDLRMVGRLLMHAQDDKLSVNEDLANYVVGLARSKAGIDPKAPFDATIGEAVVILLCLRDEPGDAEMAFDLFQREIIAGRRPGNVGMHALLSMFKSHSPRQCGSGFLSLAESAAEMPNRRPVVRRNVEIATILSLYDRSLWNDLQALAIRFPDRPEIGAVIRDAVRRFFHDDDVRGFCNMLDAMETWSFIMAKCGEWFTMRELKTEGHRGKGFTIVSTKSDKSSAYSPIDDMAMAMLYAQAWALDPNAPDDSPLERSFEILRFVMRETISAASNSKNDVTIFRELLQSITSMYVAVHESPLEAIRRRKDALVQFLLHLDLVDLERPENEQWQRQSRLVFAELWAASLGYQVDGWRSNLIPPQSGFSGSMAELDMLSALALAAARNGLVTLVIGVIRTIRALPAAWDDAEQLFGVVLEQFNSLQQARLKFEFPDLVSD